MSTVWNTEEEESFRFLQAAWDVRAAKRLLAAKKNVKVEKTSVEDCKQLLQISTPNGKGGFTMTLGVRVDWERVEIDLTSAEPKIDLSVPLIFVQTPQGNVLPIDGYHRIAKAYKLGLKELPAVMLSKKDSKAVQL
jgi:hypothetical protein